jgi:hypothetical protein
VSPRADPGHDPEGSSLVPHGVGTIGHSSRQDANPGESYEHRLPWARRAKGVIDQSRQHDRLAAPQLFDPPLVPPTFRLLSLPSSFESTFAQQCLGQNESDRAVMNSLNRSRPTGNRLSEALHFVGNER